MLRGVGRTSVRRCVAGLLAALALGSCHLLPGTDAAHRAILARQVEALERLVRRAQAGPIFDPDDLLVVVDADLVQRLLAAQLPREETVAERFRVRVSSVRVVFDDNLGLLRLDGTVSDATDPSRRVFADLRLYTEVRLVELDPESGVLRGRASLLAFDVHDVRLPGRDPLTLPLIAELGRVKLSAFSVLARPFEIPVALTREIDIAGLGAGGPISVPAGKLRLTMAVSGVLALDGRLWVAVDAGRRDWRRSSAGSSGAGR